MSVPAPHGPGDGPEGGAAADALAGALVRVPVRGHTWPDSLPPVPATDTATVTISRDRLGEVGDGALARSGYRLAGVASVLRSADAPDVVDVYVPDGLRNAHPEWFAALADRATRIFDLRFGPVRYQLAPALRLHERTLACD